MTIAESRPPVSPGRAGARLHPARRGRDADRLPGRLSRPEPRLPRPVHRALVPVLPAARSRRWARPRASSRRSGVETLGVVATPPENARLYFKFRPTRLRLAADPELTTHRAYGVPKPAATPEFMNALEATRINPDRRVPGAAARSRRRPRAIATTRRLRGEPDRPGGHGAAVAAAQGPVPDRPRRHRPLGQHRVRHRGPRRDREVPLDEEILAAARALPR